MTDPQLVLASASPRRRDILNRLGIPHIAIAADIDETPHQGELAPAYVCRVAQEKAMHVMARLALDRVVEPCFVLAADTSIFLEYKAHKNSMHDDEIPVCELMGKPQDPAECASFLHRLSGRTHRVGTAVTLGLVDTDPAILETCMCQTEVRFRSLSEQERSDYVATGEGMDKAGGYAIQGLGAGLVDEISGCYDNVVGLPSSRTIALLRRHGAISRWP